MSFTPKDSWTSGQAFAYPKVRATREKTTVITAHEKNAPCTVVVMTGEWTSPSIACTISITAAVCTTFNLLPTISQKEPTLFVTRFQPCAYSSQ